MTLDTTRSSRSGPAAPYADRRTEVSFAPAPAGRIDVQTYPGRPVRLWASSHSSARARRRAPGTCRPPSGLSVYAPQRRQMDIQPLVSGAWSSSSRAPRIEASDEIMVTPSLPCRSQPRKIVGARPGTLDISPRGGWIDFLVDRPRFSDPAPAWSTQVGPPTEPPALVSHSGEGAGALGAGARDRARLTGSRAAPERIAGGPGCSGSARPGRADGS